MRGGAESGWPCCASASMEPSCPPPTSIIRTCRCRAVRQTASTCATHRRPCGGRLHRVLRRRPVSSISCCSTCDGGQTRRAARGGWRAQLAVRLGTGVVQCWRPIARALRRAATAHSARLQCVNGGDMQRVTDSTSRSRSSARSPRPGRPAAPAQHEMDARCRDLFCGIYHALAASQDTPASFSPAS